MTSKERKERERKERKRKRREKTEGKKERGKGERGKGERKRERERGKKRVFVKRTICRCVDKKTSIKPRRRCQKTFFSFSSEEEKLRFETRTKEV